MAWALARWLLGRAGIARADVLPEPGRPEWPDTPLPQPGDPAELAIFVAVLSLAVAAAWWFGRRRARA